MKADGSIQECSILVSDENMPRKSRRVFGRDIMRITLSRVEFNGGETGHERLSVPMDSVLEIERKGRVIYRRKKRIEKIYPKM